MYLYIYINKHINYRPLDPLDPLGIRASPSSPLQSLHPRPGSLSRSPGHIKRHNDIKTTWTWKLSVQKKCAVYYCHILSHIITMIRSSPSEVRVVAEPSSSSGTAICVGTVFRMPGAVVFRMPGWGTVVFRMPGTGTVLFRMLGCSSSGSSSSSSSSDCSCSPSSCCSCVA